MDLVLKISGHCDAVGTDLCSECDHMGSSVCEDEVGGATDAYAFAICYRPSVCRLSVVCNVRAPYSGGSKFRQYFYGIRYLGHPLTFTENFTEIVPREALRQGS